MKKTTLCYLEHEGNYLMLLRNKKPNDPNWGKYIGIGGKFEEGETPEQCMLREMKEEAGLQLSAYEYRGLVHFVSDTWEDEDMYLFSASCADCALDSVPECAEGTFEWIPLEKVEDLPLWEGDRVFLRALAAGERDINLRLEYQGDTLARVTELVPR